MLTEGGRYMKTLIYDCYGAHCNGEHRKPSEVLKALGIHPLSWEAEPVFDRIVITTDSDYEQLPKYIREL